MMVYRSLVVGLLGAITMLVASRPGAAPVPVAVAAVAASAPVATAAVVDVSRARAGADPMPLLGLVPGERVVEVDGVAADGAALVARWSRVVTGEYVDVAVSGPGGDRRVLVLAHP